MQHTKAIDFAIEKLQDELPENLKYHSLEHTLGVLHSCEYLAEKHILNPDEVKLLFTAAAFHDIGFTHAYKNHEEVGCEIAGEVLPQFDYSSDEIERIKGMIMATKIPQTPKNLLEKILCDADLDYLGGDKYGEISESLKDELGLNGVEMDDGEWLKLQINFLESHHYWTDFAKRVLAPKKVLVLQKLKNQRQAE